MVTHLLLGSPKDPYRQQEMVTHWASCITDSSLLGMVTHLLQDRQPGVVQNHL